PATGAVRQSQRNGSPIPPLSVVKIHRTNEQHERQQGHGRKKHKDLQVRRPVAEAYKKEPSVSSTEGHGGQRASCGSGLRFASLLVRARLLAYALEPEDGTAHSTRVLLIDRKGILSADGHDNLEEQIAKLLQRPARGTEQR